jgi:hypothetical protein
MFGCTELLDVLAAKRDPRSLRLADSGPSWTTPPFAWLKDEDGHITERIREAVDRGSPVTVSVGAV